MTQVGTFPHDLTDLRPPSGRIWSLWEIMNHFNTHRVAVCVANIATFLGAFDSVSASSYEAIDQFAEELGHAVIAFERSGMKQVSQQLATIKSNLDRPHMKHVALAAEARHALDLMLGVLKERKFLRVGLSRARYLDKDHLFGEGVAAAFPSASHDIKEAGNCLAAECGTASVFHLMRAAEIGLRALANDRQISFSKGTLDAKQWGEIVSQLEAYAGRLITVPATKWLSEPVRQAQIRFYQQAMIECRAFNDAWRRHIAHAHEGAFYDCDQATSVLNHTKRFMKMLATKISEGVCAPEYWTDA